MDGRLITVVSVSVMYVQIFITEAVIRMCSAKSFAKFTEKHLCQSLFFNKVAGHRSIFKEHPQWLLLLLVHIHLMSIQTQLKIFDQDDFIIPRFD